MDSLNWTSRGYQIPGLDWVQTYLAMGWRYLRANSGVGGESWQEEASPQPPIQYQLLPGTDTEISLESWSPWVTMGGSGRLTEETHLAWLSLQWGTVVLQQVPWEGNPADAGPYRDMQCQWADPRAPVRVCKCPASTLVPEELWY